MLRRDAARDPQDQRLKPGLSARPATGDSDFSSSAAEAVPIAPSRPHIIMMPRRSRTASPTLENAVAYASVVGTMKERRMSKSERLVLYSRTPPFTAR